MTTQAPERPPAAAPPPVAATPKPRRRAPKFTMAIPAWAWLLVFFLIPVGFIFVYSFGRKPGLLELKPGQINTIALDQWPSFERYKEVLDGPILSTFQNTLQIAIIGTLACLVIGFPFAYWLAVKVPEKYRAILLGLILVPFWTNFLIRTIAWQILLFPEGWFSGLLQDIGLLSGPLAVLDTRAAVQIGVVYNYLVLMILPLFVALDRIDPALRDGSKDLGANRVKTFMQVTLPLAMPGVVSGLLLVFIPLMGDYITASILGGAKGTMAGQLVYDQFLVAQNWALGSAMAMFLIMTILLTVLMFGLVFLLVAWVLRRRRRVTLTEVTA
jgi:spermidine/putrescine transport system permease protein